MKRTSDLEPHELVKLLRNGEKIQCSRCKIGIFVPVGDAKRTNTFHCSNCESQLIMD